MTIHEIKARVESKGEESYFFSHKTLKFFGQTLKSFSVKARPDGKFYICAPIYDNSGRFNPTDHCRLMGYTERLFNPETNELESVPVEERRRV